MQMHVTHETNEFGSHYF